jgi:deoxyribose-phosphate aldolase
MSSSSIDLDALAARVARELARADRPAVRAGTAGSAGLAPLAVAVGGPPGVRFVCEGARIADFIDHTVLKAETTRDEIEKVCDEAVEHHFAAVCVNPAWIAVCAKRLGTGGVGLASVIGFPLGANRSETKADEARRAVQDGATELDMVVALGHLKSGDWSYVADDVAAVVRASGGRVVKVIIESAALTPVEIIKASAIAKEMGAQYVKTSTGFHAAGGASAEAVALMRLVVGDALGVKASGGVRDCATALKMIASGATRIGTSSGVAMAACLGRGPLPLRDLLAQTHTHAATCQSAACSVEPAVAKAY